MKLPNHLALDPKKANEIGGALARVAELSDLKILTKENDGELNALKVFLNQAYNDHAAEFLGCWFTIRQEYEPMLRVMASVATRIDTIKAMAQARQGAAEPEAPAKE